MLFRRKKTTFETLLEPHLESLYHYAYRLCGNDNDAEELIQDYIVKIYSSKVDLNDIQHLASWLKRGIHNQFVDNYRRNAKKHSVDDMDVFIESLNQDQWQQLSEPESAAETEIQQKLIRQLLDYLSPTYRSIIILHDIEENSLAEIANILNEPINTVKTRLYRARSQLKEMLLEQFTNNDSLEI